MTKTRRMDPEDVPRIIAIQEAITKKRVSRTWVQMVDDHLRSQEKVGLVALEGSRVLGFIIGEVKGEGFGLAQSGWIEVVGVDPPSMGSGIGTTLVEELFRYFRENRIVDIHTSVRWDAVDMLSFFKSLGFGRSDFINLEKHL